MEAAHQQLAERWTQKKFSEQINKNLRGQKHVTNILQSRVRTQVGVRPSYLGPNQEHFKPTISLHPFGVNSHNVSA